MEPKVIDQFLLNAAHDAVVNEELEPGLLSRLYHKIDRRTLPLMFLCYFLSILNNNIVNYATSMGLQQSVPLADDQVSWITTVFYIGYGTAQIPQAYFLHRFPAAKVLGLNVVCWGVVTCCTPAVSSFRDLLVIRTLLGCSEAVTTPALVLITSQWYTNQRATPRMGAWYCGLGVAQIVGSFISFASQDSSTVGPFPAWRIMFVAVGIFTVLVGISIIAWLPEDINSAFFLREEEKYAIRMSLPGDRAGSGPEKFQLASVGEAFADTQTWLLAFLGLVITVPGGFMGNYSQLLILALGYTPKQSALLTMPSGVVCLIGTLSSTFVTRKDVPRWLGICALTVPTMIGAGLLSFYDGGQPSIFAGLYLFNFGPTPMALVFAFAGSNTVGYTKRIIVNAVIVIGFTFPNAIPSQSFLDLESSQMLTAKALNLAASGAAFVAAIILRILYGYRNSKAMKSRQTEGEAFRRKPMSPHGTQRERLADNARRSFRYIY
ncbi:putative allantoate permease [Thozetella sp. PMI_491]|nr:putative allantoate permease [Thozetella sp. PMI_491]